MALKACSVTAGPGRRPAWRPCRRPACVPPAARPRTARPLRASAARPATASTSRTAASSGSSASAACASKVSISNGGAWSSPAGSTRRPGTAPGTKPCRAGHLLQVARRPGRGVGTQRHRQLRVVLAGEGVELLGARRHLEHVGQLDHRAGALGEGLHLLHELGVLDLVERAAAVGQLHAGLQLAVALTRRDRLPLAGLGVQPLEQKRLAAGAPRRSARAPARTRR